MNIYQKLNAARDAFHKIKLTKTGHNTFAKYHYFELGDFLIPALAVFKDFGLCAKVSFSKDVATMTIIDADKPTDYLLIESPMGSAQLKGCHEVQNIGAVETYQRRYLWVAALEIVEHDAIDSMQPVISTPTGTPIVDQHRMSVIADVADAIKQHMAGDDVIGAYEEASGITDPEERTAMWKLLDSKTRSALKTHSQSLKEKA